MTREGPVALWAPEPPLGDGAVLLRPPHAGDVPDIVLACRDPEITRWTTVPEGYTDADAAAFVGECAVHLGDGTGLVLVIAPPDGGRLLGMAALHMVAADVAAIGYWAAPWARGQGYVSRAVRLLTGWGLGAAGLARIDLMTLPGNRASEWVAARCGYRRAGLVAGAGRHRGETVDMWAWERRAGSPENV